jgi:polysaccharide pyruvyl transferase WcaK-like protein
MAAAVHLGLLCHGSTNAGDDLMLAGLLDVWRRHAAGIALTGAVHAERLPRLQQYFPEVRWLPRDRHAALLRDCDLWLGAGSTPFQSDGGMNILNRLAEDAELCARLDKPMYFVGVGVNNRAALDLPQTRRVLAQTAHIWARDEQSAALLAEVFDTGKLSVGADLAHLCLRQLRPEPKTAGSVGLTLHFEREGAFTIEAIAELLHGLADRPRHWLVQERRLFEFSERWLHQQLPRNLAGQIPQHAAEGATLADLLAAWPLTEHVLSSRYHSTLVGAWRGARLVVVERNLKLTGAAQQLGGAASVADLRDASAVRQALASSRPVERGLLTDLADRAETMCRAFFSLMTKGRLAAEPAARAGLRPCG